MEPCPTKPMGPVLLPLALWHNVVAIVLCAVLHAALPNSSAAQHGAIDPTFNPSDVGFSAGDGPAGDVHTTVVQPDGKILIGGDFTTYNGTTCNRLIRLHSDGSVDTGFDSGLTLYSAIINAVAVQADGKILVVGEFDSFHLVWRRRIVRLNADGSLDTGFDPGSGTDGTINSVAIQADGKILIGGDFYFCHDAIRKCLARLNTDGSLDTSFDPGTGANNAVHAIAVQADGRVLVGGYFTIFNGADRGRIARLHANGALDTGFDPGTGADDGVFAITPQTDGKIMVGGAFMSYNGMAINRIARLNANGTLDTGLNLTTGANSHVRSIVIQPDGRIIIGGAFATYNGTSRNGIARLNTNGALDTSFNPGTGAAGGTLRSIAIQSDGRILAGGHFTSFNGTPRNRIVRLNANGGLDAGFNKVHGANHAINAISVMADGKILIGGVFTGYNNKICGHIARLHADGSQDIAFNSGTGANEEVRAMSVQADGKILIAGFFTSYNGTVRNRIARLNADGSLDTGFNPGAGANGGVSAIALQPDGKILIGGDFTSYNGTGRNRIARLNANGTLDTGFNPGAGANDQVRSIAIQPDGRVLIGGDFTSYNGTARIRIARLNANGALHTGFDAGAGPDDSVYSIAYLPEGSILIAGVFFQVNGTDARRLARLNADGSLDTSFNPGYGSDGSILSMAIQRDGKILISGWFNAYAMVSRNRIARLNADGSLDMSFDPGSGANGWIRSFATQADGLILIGGEFTGYNGTGRNRIARLLGGSLQTDAIAEVTWCSGSSLSVPFTTTGPFNAGNIFTAQLSDASGSFTNPMVIGTLAGTGSGSISAAIPLGTPAGSGYRIRVVSSNPALTGNENDTDLTVVEAAIWYADADGDGYGDPDSPLPACAQPSGHVTNSDDCDDADPAWPNACGCSILEATVSTADACESMSYLATIHVSSIGDLAGVDIISSIHGTIASGVGVGDHPSLLTGFGTEESFTVLGNDAEGCSMNVQPVNSLGSACAAWLVPHSGSNRLKCGNDTILRDHADAAEYAVYADGHTILEANGTAMITVTGTYYTEYSWDKLRIYAGAGTSGALLQTYTGSGFINFTGAPGQTLTVRFTSDEVGVSSGFDLVVRYAGTCACASPMATTSAIDDCSNLSFTAAVEVTDPGDAVSMVIISSIHGTIASGVGAGTYPSLPNGFGVSESFTVLHGGHEACNLSLGPVSNGSACPPVLVPFSGSNSVACGSSTILRDHANGSQYSSNANGYTVLEANITAIITISGSYGTEAGLDHIRIYDGAGTSGAILQSYSGNGTVQFTGAPGQTLTVGFTSDGGSVNFGFDFLVIYTGACVCSPATATASVTDACGSMTYTATVEVSSLGTATGVDIISSIHGTIASGVGLGSYASLPNVFGIPESLTMVNGDDEECSLVMGPVTSTGDGCTPILVPYLGSLTIPCGTSTFLRDHMDEGDYGLGANGYVVLEATAPATITISGGYDIESDWDFIRIYSGAGTGGALLQSYTGTGTVNFTGAPGQTLTVRFTSDEMIAGPGFDLMVIYAGSCTCTGSSPNDSDGDGFCDDTDDCPLAVNGIPNFDMGSCACEPGYATRTVDMNGNQVIVACEVPPCGIVPGTPIVQCEGLTIGQVDTYRVIIPYTGVQPGVAVVNNSGSGLVQGNDPAVVTNGTIQINGISEQDDYSITFTSPCASYTISGPAPACDPPLGTLLINEVDYDNPGTDNNEWIELYNPGPDPAIMSDFQLHLVNGLNGTVYRIITNLPPTEVPPGGYFVIGNNAANPAVDHVALTSTDLLQNGAPDAIALVRIWDLALIDAISYEGSLAAPYVEGTGFVGGDDNSTVGKVIARIPNGSDTDDNSADWRVWCATPGASNSNVPDGDGDGLPDCIDTCPLALNNIANFDAPTCGCLPGYLATYTNVGGNDLLTACTSDFDCPLLGADIGDPCDDGNPITTNDVIGSDCVCAGTPSGVLVAARVFLEGGYDEASGLMRDDLRALGLVPTVEPYTALGYGYVSGGGESISPSVLATTGNDAIVDWVVLELRDKDLPVQVLHSRSALLQRDGDVVDMDGVSPLLFPTGAGSYLVAVLHRNHLACMTAAPVVLGAMPAAIDLTLASTATFGTDARKLLGGAYPAAVLWAGDVTFDGTLRYTGQENDRDPMLQAIGGAVPTNTVSGYHQEDVNMDGTVRYIGADNDRDPILVNIGGVVPTETRTEQMP